MTWRSHLASIRIGRNMTGNTNAHPVFWFGMDTGEICRLVAEILRHRASCPFHSNLWWQHPELKLFGQDESCLEKQKSCFEINVLNICSVFLPRSVNKEWPSSINIRLCQMGNTLFNSRSTRTYYLVHSSVCCSKPSKKVINWSWSPSPAVVPVYSVFVDEGKQKHTEWWTLYRWFKPTLSSHDHSYKLQLDAVKVLTGWSASFLLGEELMNLLPVIESEIDFPE